MLLRNLKLVRFHVCRSAQCHYADQSRHFAIELLVDSSHSAARIGSQANPLSSLAAGFDLICLSTPAALAASQPFQLSRVVFSISKRFVCDFGAARLELPLGSARSS